METIDGRERAELRAFATAFFGDGRWRERRGDRVDANREAAERIGRALGATFAWRSDRVGSLSDLALFTVRPGSGFIARPPLPDRPAETVWLAGVGGLVFDLRLLLSGVGPVAHLYLNRRELCDNRSVRVAHLFAERAPAEIRPSVDRLAAAVAAEGFRRPSLGLLGEPIRLVPDFPERRDGAATLHSHLFGE